MSFNQNVSAVDWKELALMVNKKGQKSKQVCDWMEMA